MKDMKEIHRKVLSRRTVLAGAVAAPALLMLPRGAMAQTTLTLGHGTAPGNPRSVAADRMAALLQERSNGRIEMRVAGSSQLGDDLAMLTGLRTGTLDHVREQPGPGLVRGAGAGRLRPALPVPDAARRPTASSTARSGRRSRAARRRRTDLARLVGQRHPPHHQQQATD